MCSPWSRFDVLPETDSGTFANLLEEHACLSFAQAGEDFLGPSTAQPYFFL